ncbi:transposon Ty3-G Gag-Pol polyprotein [Trichonephila clavipes]|nr:transposon Ty3-G Gag-Pol polyprotein [Trichonephila clavipes]
MGLARNAMGLHTYSLQAARTANASVKANKGLDQNLPISLRPYRNSQQESKEIQTQIEELLKAGFIRPSHSPYAAPVALAYKRMKGKRSRLCIDYRKLNENHTKIPPVPLIDFMMII